MSAEATIANDVKVKDLGPTKKCLTITVPAEAIDEKLNDKKYIVPGLGDAGDRLFGTSHQ